jgi:FecR protein
MLPHTLFRTALAVLALLPIGVFAAAPIGMFTIVEGEVIVMRDTQRFAGAEGVRLRADDIVRTGSETRLARVELGDGTVLDIGPGSELLLQPRAFSAQSGRAATLYLARGWIKLASPAQASQTPASLTAPQLDLVQVSGTAVARVSPQGSLVFAETGRTELTERLDGKAGANHNLKDGDSFVQRGTGAGSLQRRPPADMLQGLPRSFLDSLPRRAQRFQGAPVEPAASSDVTYADVAAWINAEAALRPSFVQRFATLAREKNFRAGLVAELRAHPEWDRTLFPEKYRPKPPPAPVVAKRPTVSPAALATVPPSWLDAIEPGLSMAPLQARIQWPAAERVPGQNPTSETP